MRSTLFLSAVLSLVFFGAPASASVIYSVTVDTSSIFGTTGYLDFQFNPGNSSTQLATASVSGFSGGTLGSTTPNAGSVSGSLPVELVFTNSSALNEYFRGFTYGSSFNFLLTLSGPALDLPNGTSTAGSTFGFGLYDSGQNPLLTNQGAISGFAGSADINLNGSVTLTAFPTAGNGNSVVTFSSVPEPGTLLLIGLGIVGLAYSARRSARQTLG